MSFTLKLNESFCENKKDGYFHYKNFLRALKGVPTQCNRPKPWGQNPFTVAYPG